MCSVVFQCLRSDGAVVGKASALKAIALTQEEPRFVAQNAGIGALVVLMTFAVKKFQPQLNGS